MVFENNQLQSAIQNLSKILTKFKITEFKSSQVHWWAHTILVISYIFPVVQRHVISYVVAYSSPFLLILTAWYSSSLLCLLILSENWNFASFAENWQKSQKSQKCFSSQVIWASSRQKLIKIHRGISTTHKLIHTKRIETIQTIINK